MTNRGKIEMEKNYITAELAERLLSIAEDMDYMDNIDNRGKYLDNLEIAIDDLEIMAKENECFRILIDTLLLATNLF